MPKYDVVAWYSETVYGKACKYVEADSEEEAIAKAFEEDGEWEFKEKGSSDFEMDSGEAEAHRV